MTSLRQPRTAAVILAGGRGSRMAGHQPKPLMPLGGRPLIAWVLAALPAGIDVRIVNAESSSLYAGFGLPVVPDRRPDHAGPLAGLEAATRWLGEYAPDITHLLSLPADTPFLTAPILETLLTPQTNLARIARQGGRLHPAVGLWPVERLRELPAYLDGPSKPSLRAFAQTIGLEAVDCGEDLTFMNINTPDELADAEQRLVNG